mmetsp:Transcript_9380/g.7164  ORF Transcript_9380/g.7164 Transcript_9380/m.7164 type:complete len:88 (-) Transcript_9380:287-550(-)
MKLEKSKPVVVVVVVAVAVAVAEEVEVVLERHHACPPTTHHYSKGFALPKHSGTPNRLLEAFVSGCFNFRSPKPKSTNYLMVTQIFH